MPVLLQIHLFYYKQKSGVSPLSDENDKDFTNGMDFIMLCPWLQGSAFQSNKNLINLG
jgi:hypothetical protein